MRNFSWRLNTLPCAGFGSILNSTDAFDLTPRGYRGIRIEELKLSARVAAGRVRETHAPFRFNAMSSRERRILHLVLKEESGVRSESEGAGEERQVVVYPAN